MRRLGCFCSQAPKMWVQNTIKCSSASVKLIIFAKKYETCSEVLVELEFFVYLHSQLSIMVRWMSGLVTGLQNRLQRFESASDLKKPFYKHLWRGFSFITHRPTHTFVNYAIKKWCVQLLDTSITLTPSFGSKSFSIHYCLVKQLLLSACQRALFYSTVAARMELFEKLADISFGFEVAEKLFAQQRIGRYFVTLTHNYMFLQS